MADFKTDGALDATRTRRLKRRERRKKKRASVASCACVAAVRHSDARASLARERVRKSDADDVAAAPRCKTATESASNQRCKKREKARERVGSEKGNFEI